MEASFLGIDVGTGSLKCVVVDEKGTLLFEGQSGYLPEGGLPGMSRQDPEVWFDACIEVLETLRKERPEIPDTLSAVGVSGQMRGLTLLDARGAVLSPSILWNDTLCADEIGTVRETAGSMVEEVTRNPLNTMCTLPKILDVRRKDPDLWGRTATIIFPKDYLVYRLSGAIQTDHSDASGSSLYDMHWQEWSEEILSLFSIRRGKLPPLRSSSDVVGAITAEASSLTGLPAGIPVVAGACDGITEMIACGVTGEDRCKVRLGTSGALSRVSRHLPEPGSRRYCWSFGRPGLWMIDINTRSCAQSVDWASRIFYGLRSERPEEIYSLMESEARTSPQGSRGIFFHPYLMGEDAPYWDPGLTAGFHGLKVDHLRGDLVRAVFEGTAFSLRDAMSLFDEGGNRFDGYVFTGGGVKNRLWLQIVADVLGAGGVAVPGGSAVGAAVLAAEGIGTAVECTNPGEGAVVTYDRKNHEQYNALFEEYRMIKRLSDRGDGAMMSGGNE